MAMATIGLGCFPAAMDTQVVYWVDGKVYDATGKLLFAQQDGAGTAATAFRPTTAKSAVEILEMQR